MKLAPQNTNTLQPLPSDVQPAVSQSVQRTASPADIQAAQLSQESQQLPAGQTTGGQSNIIAAQFSSASAGSLWWILLALALIIAAGAAWLWRSF